MVIELSRLRVYIAPFMPRRAWSTKSFTASARIDPGEFYVIDFGFAGNIER